RSRGCGSAGSAPRGSPPAGPPRPTGSTARPGPPPGPPRPAAIGAGSCGVRSPAPATPPAVPGSWPAGGRGPDRYGVRVLLASDQGLAQGPPGQPEDGGGDAGPFDVGVLQHLLDAVADVAALPVQERCPCTVEAGTTHRARCPATPCRRRRPYI